MKKALVFIELLAVLSLGMGLAACASSDSAAQTTTVAEPQNTASSYFSGDGGKGTSIAILPLQDTGLTAEQTYLPALVQGELVSNFKGYSAIGVLDRAQLDNQYNELLSGYYDDDAKVGADLGHLTPTDYILGGTIIKTATGYAMQIQITKSADKMTAASYSGSCTFMELDNLTGIRRASLDLLQKIGVQPTEQTKTELAGAARAQTVASQTADARGYTADKGGRTAEAAIYYTQAAAIDPSMLQTASRASTLTAQIASGSIGAGTRDLIQQRKDWMALLAETEETIYTLISTASGNPPYALYYSNNIKWGDINYTTESRDARFETNLRGRGYWFDSVRVAAQSVYGAVYDGLGRTGHKDEWGLGNWPGSGVTQRNPFSASWRHDINVVFELVNNQGKAIGKQTYSKRAEYQPRRDGNKVSMAYNTEDFATLSFNGVKAADISDWGMSIRVASVNGKPPEQTPFQITMIPDWEGNTFLLVSNRTVTGFRSGFDIADLMVKKDILNRRGKVGYSRSGRELVIPATLWAEPVTGVGDNAFADKQLKWVVIPDSVTTIGNNAFANNPLFSVVIPDSVTTIGNKAFINNAPTSTTSDGYTRISSPDSIIIGKGITSIPNDAFAFLSLLPTHFVFLDTLYVTIPANVTFVRASAEKIEREFYWPEERDWHGGSFIDIYERKGKKAGKYGYNTGVMYAWKYFKE